MLAGNYHQERAAKRFSKVKCVPLRKLEIGMYQWSSVWSGEGLGKLNV